MSDSDSDYNERQYDLMLRTISGYRDGSIQLGHLVNSLEALNSALQDPTAEWLDTFGRAWGRLEDVYAVMLDEGRTGLDAADVELVDEAIAMLRVSIQRELNKGDG